jgi:hypothetical protein
MVLGAFRIFKSKKWGWDLKRLGTTALNGLTQGWANYCPYEIFIRPADGFVKKLHCKKFGFLYVF